VKINYYDSWDALRNAKKYQKERIPKERTQFALSSILHM
jgi:hypothetical protein